jgi:hypothetical protein
MAFYLHSSRKCIRVLCRLREASWSRNKPHGREDLLPIMLGDQIPFDDQAFFVDFSDIALRIHS